jgi:hypothetical protein
MCSSLWPLYTLCKVTRRSLEKKKKRGDWFGFYSNFLMSSYSLCSAAGEKTPAPLSSSFALPGARNQLECKVVFIKERDVGFLYTTSFLNPDRCVNDSRPQRKKRASFVVRVELARGRSTSRLMWSERTRLQKRSWNQKWLVIDSLRRRMNLGEFILSGRVVSSACKRRGPSHCIWWTIVSAFLRGNKKKTQ